MLFKCRCQYSWLHVTCKLSNRSRAKDLTSSACYSLIQHLCHLSFWRIKVQSAVSGQQQQQQQHVCSMSVNMALNNVLVYFCPHILTNSPMLLVILKDVLISICIRSCLKISKVSSPLCSAVTYSSSCDPVTRSQTHHFFRNSVVSNKPSNVKNLWD